MRIVGYIYLILITILVIFVATWTHQIETQLNSLCTQHGYDGGGWSGEAYCYVDGTVQVFHTHYQHKGVIIPPE